MIIMLLVQYRSFAASLVFFTLFTLSTHSVDYNFNIDDNNSSGKNGKKDKIKRDDRDQAKPDQSKLKKDSVSSADVFELFKGEQKVAIVSKKEERVQDAPATIYVVGDKEIKERGYMFLHDLLRDVPGFDLIRRTRSRNPTFRSRSQRSPPSVGRGLLHGVVPISRSSSASKTCAPDGSVSSSIDP